MSCLCLKIVAIKKVCLKKGIKFSMIQKNSFECVEFDGSRWNLHIRHRGNPKDKENTCLPGNSAIVTFLGWWNVTPFKGYISDLQLQIGDKKTVTLNHLFFWYFFQWLFSDSSCDWKKVTFVECVVGTLPAECPAWWWHFIEVFVWGGTWCDREVFLELCRTGRLVSSIP